jgi:hypothetical protein
MLLAGSMIAPEGSYGVIHSDTFSGNGFAGPAFVPEATQVIIIRSYYGVTSANIEGPISDLAIVDISAPSATIEWASTLYGDGLLQYNDEGFVALATALAFDFDFRDPDTDGMRAMGAGHMIIGNMLTWMSEWFQLRGTYHHLEAHSDTLNDRQVAVVVRTLRHTIYPNTAPAVPACDYCGAGTRDHDSDPVTACEPCGQGTFSGQSAVTQCVGTCQVGNTILSTGETSGAACSHCTAGLYGSLDNSVAV